MVIKMKKTKIICTIGPSSENEETLTQMCLAGMNVARLNFSHGSHEEQKKKIDLVKKIREKMKLPIAIMLDTKGPEYRIKTFENGKITLADGDTFTFTTDDIVGNQERVSVNYVHLVENLKVGDTILVNNGLVIFEVIEIKKNDAICKVIAGGELSNRKSMNFPNKVMDNDYLSEQDKKDLLFGIENEVDFVAASFVSTKQDVANAVYDGTSAIMLSGETAAGKYPVAAVKTMAEVAEYTENQINYMKRFRTSDFEIRNNLDAISHSACSMAVDVKAKCMVVSSISGCTVRMVSRFRCPVDIIGMTTSEKVWRKLNLSWGVIPVMCEEFNSVEVMFYNAVNEAKKVLKLKKGDNVVLTGGQVNGQTGNTNLIKVEMI